jgi:hypothetical protein
MSYLDHKYISLLAVRLRNFKRKSQNLYNFSCPLCLDSKTKTNRARGYLYERGTVFLFHCHNCGVSMRFDTFLKQLDYRLHSDYRMEVLNLLPQTDTDTWETKKPVFNVSNAKAELNKLRTISQLAVDHPAKIYIQQRQIPNRYHALFRWCPKFKEFTNKLIPDKFEEPIQLEEGRIIIPYFSKQNKFFAYNGRAIHSTKQGLRYIVIILDHDIPRIFGMNTVDLKKDIFVFEGEMDATFIPNSLAIGGQHISELTSVTSLDKFIIIFDNEPHSIQTRKKFTLAIKLGFRVGIWPDRIKEKDVNAMILGDYTANHLKHIIETNTFSGLAAQTRLAEWSKV